MSLRHIFNGSFILPVKKWLENDGFTTVTSKWSDFDGYYLEINGGTSVFATQILRWDHFRKYYIIIGRRKVELLDHNNPDVFRKIKKFLEQELASLGYNK